MSAIDFYKDQPIGLCIVPGEEVHMPSVDGINPDFHIVNFGGTYSVNALTDGEAIEAHGTDKKYRSLNGNCPEYMPLEAWREMIRQKAAKIKTPKGVNAIQVAVCEWICEEIHNADGLDIFAHPFWINDVFHVPQVFVDYITENKLFDAFEVLGGENNYEY